MDSITKQSLKGLIKAKIVNKIKSYKPSTTYNPFLTGIVPLKYARINSFMISLSTSFGMSVYEQISKLIAESNGFKNCGKRNLYETTTLSDNQIKLITEIIERLTKKGQNANYDLETKEILDCIAVNGKKFKGNSIVDFSMEKNSIIYLFEIKTVKPNKDVFIASKRKLLQWRARLSNKKVKTFLAFPYNPYYPEPYEHFAKGNFLERGKEFLIGKEYWDFLGGSGTYEQIIEVFKEVGEELSNLIKTRIKEIKKGNSAPKTVSLDDYLN